MASARLREVSATPLQQRRKLQPLCLPMPLILSQESRSRLHRRPVERILRPCKNAAVAAVRAAVTSDEAQAEQARETAVQALARSQNIPIEQRSHASRGLAVAAADAAASGASTAAIAAFFALLLGAVAAWFGGRVGIAAPIVTADTRTIIGRHV